MSDKIKFLEKDIEYWEIQNDLYYTERTKESLSWAIHRLEQHKEEVDDKLNNRTEKKGKLLRFRPLGEKDE